MLAYHITAAITACIIIIDMAIPLTRASRLAAMRESDERITSIFHTLLTRPPVFSGDSCSRCRASRSLWEASKKN